MSGTIIALGISACRRYSGLDADAIAYITAITAAGATVTDSQRAAINAFIVAEKESGRWAAAHKRIFFPVWAVAAANAICMRSLTTGTWVNSPTQAAGYVQGDGTTQYFDMGATDTSLGLSAEKGCLMSLVLQADNRTDARSMMGVTNANGFFGQEFSNTSAVRMFHGNGTLGQGQITATLSPRSNQTGILTSSFDGTTRRMRVRKTSGVSQLVESGGIAYGTNVGVNIPAMALNSFGSIVRHSDARFGAFGVSLIESAAQHDAMTLTLKTLWETVTGLTLP